MPSKINVKTTKNSNKLRSRLKKTTSKRVTRNSKKYLSIKKRSYKKRRINKRRSAKKLYQQGGKFNDAEKTQIINKLKELGVTNDNTINNYIEKFDLSSQLFSGKHLDQLLQQLEFIPLTELDEWVYGLDNLEEQVETDVEDEDTEDSENSE
jgi:hypothetical protein